ncbi:MAG TPA: hypothetical protein VMU64_05290 [Acidimicrobiales bacterium]|nr:hypothetical protein [Acidimicrobiales bacterium]
MALYVAGWPAWTCVDSAWNRLASEDPEDDPADVVVAEAVGVVVFLVDEFVGLLHG